MPVYVRLEDQPLVPQRELAELIAQAAGDGAVVSFVGLARGTAKDGETVDQLVLEHHPVMTVQSMEQIGSDALARFGVTHSWIVHRCGSVDSGEPIVFAAASSPHRRAAFEAADFMMDQLKTDAVFWKREQGPNGSNWIEPTEADRADRAKWDQ
ncbi:MAG: molybdenum cofactor biosynthesis protein MoaE [Sphingomicrobium sp.]